MDPGAAPNCTASTTNPMTPLHCLNSMVTHLSPTTFGTSVVPHASALAPQGSLISTSTTQNSPISTTGFLIVKTVTPSQQPIPQVGQFSTGTNLMFVTTQPSMSGIGGTPTVTSVPGMTLKIVAAHPPTPGIAGTPTATSVPGVDVRFVPLQSSMSGLLGTPSVTSVPGIQATFKAVSTLPTNTCPRPQLSNKHSIIQPPTVQSAIDNNKKFLFHVDVDGASRATVSSDLLTEPSDYSRIRGNLITCVDPDGTVRMEKRRVPEVDDCNVLRDKNHVMHSYPDDVDLGQQGDGTRSVVTPHVNFRLVNKETNWPQRQIVKTKKKKKKKLERQLRREKKKKRLSNLSAVTQSSSAVDIIPSKQDSPTVTTSSHDGDNTRSTELMDCSTVPISEPEYTEDPPEYKHALSLTAEASTIKQELDIFTDQPVGHLSAHMSDSVDTTSAWKDLPIKTEEEILTRAPVDDLDGICSVDDTTACVERQQESKATSLNNSSTETPKINQKDQCEPPSKIRKTSPNPSSSKQGSQLDKGESNAATSPDAKDERVDVLQDCVVRKAIQDCYSEGQIPTIDKIYEACDACGLAISKSSVEPHLTSIGYNWVELKSRLFLLENHQLTTERIRYLCKLKKYQRDQLVYIFVSDCVQMKSNGWEVSSSSACPVPAHVVLHAMRNEGLLSGRVLETGSGTLLGHVVSWMISSVVPKIPAGSVVILGNHSVFDKNEDGPRPNFEWPKSEIVSWLTSHGVTSVKPDLPKAMLLTKADRVVLPKTSIFDKLLKQNGLVPLHLPNHHSDLNPIQFLWRDIWEKLISTQIKIDFEEFISRELFSGSRTASSVACNLVKKFASSYQEFDYRFDEVLDNLVRQVSLGDDGAQLANAADTKEMKRRKKKGSDSQLCSVCLRFKDSKRCSSCKRFWAKLCKQFKSGEDIPVCKSVDHKESRPPDCPGCRRHRYESRVLYNCITIGGRHSYALLIPPVTDMGRNFYPGDNSPAPRLSSSRKRKK